MTRRGTTPTPRDYCEVRIQWLRDERAKNDDATSLLVLDKSIYELSIVLDLLTRQEPSV